MRQRSLRTDRQGAALVEFVVLLPLFLVLVVGVMFLFKTIESRQLAMLAARGCGWQYAMVGCESVPPGCDIFPRSETDTSGFDEMKNGLTERSWLDAVSHFPVIGNAIKVLFGEGKRGTVAHVVHRPALFGGGEFRVEGSFYVLCNTKDKTLGEMATETFCTLIPDWISDKLSTCEGKVDTSTNLDDLGQNLPEE
jgi:hypothetical protein